jgi:hypothetical protein
VISAVKLFAASLYEEAPTPAKPAPKRAPKPAKPAPKRAPKPAKPTPKPTHKPAPNPTLTRKQELQERDRNLKAMSKEMAIARKNQANFKRRRIREQNRMQKEKEQTQKKHLESAIRNGGKSWTMDIPVAKVGMMERVRNIFGPPTDLQRYHGLLEGGDNKKSFLQSDAFMML